MRERNKVVSEEEFVERYEERFGEFPIPPGQIQVDLRDVDIPVTHLQKFLITGRFNSFFDEAMANYGVSLIAWLNEHGKRESSEYFAFLGVHPDVRVTSRIRTNEVGTEEQIVVARGQVHPFSGFTPELVGVHGKNNRVDRLELRMLPNHTEQTAPIDFISRREQKVVALAQRSR